MVTSPVSLQKIKIFADGASVPSILESARNPRIAGFTTNPTLMRKDGVSDYRAFAKEVLAHVKTQPISFEVFSDEAARIGGTDRHPSPMTYLAMAIGF